MKEQATILVTGATGFVGRHLLPALLKKYDRVSALVRKSSNVEFLKKINIELRFADLLDKKSLEDCVKDVNVVIHMAALMADKDYFPKEEFYKVNVLGTMNLLEACASKIKQFIYISTVGIYGPTEAWGADENNCYGVYLSDYEHSKAQAEKVILDFASGNNLSYTILRLGQLYGPYMSYGWPEIFDRTERGKMLIAGDGKKLIQLTYISDAVSGIISTILNSNCFNQVFNICSERAHELRDVFFTIARQLNKPRPKKIPYLAVYILAKILEFIPYRMRAMLSLQFLDLHRLSFFSQHHVYRIDKARKCFNFQPAKDLPEGMAETLRWYKDDKKRGLKNG